MEITQQNRLLLVEDIPQDAVLAESEIRKVLKNCEIKVVDTKASFLEALGNFRPDVIISDFHLPSFDGLTALNIVIERSPKTPVIILTGSMNEDVAVECMKAGAVDYVIKEHIKRLGRAVLNALKQKEINAEKIEAETALKLSEERFRRLAENAQDLIYRYELIPTRGFTYVSPVAKQFTGFTPEDHYANPDLVFELVHIDDRHLIDNLLKSKDEIKSTITLRWIRQDGVTIWTEQRINLIYNDQQRLIAFEGIARDITERKRLEERFNLEAMTRKILMEKSQDGIAIISQEHKVVESNQKFAEMLGYNQEEVLNLHTWDWEVSRTEKEIRKVFKDLTKISLVFETKHRRKDGSVCDVEVSAGGAEVNGLPMILTVSRNITERKRAEEEIREKNKDLANLFEISLELLEHVDKKTVLQKIVESSAKLIGLDMGVIYLLDNDDLVIEATVPPLHDNFPKKTKVLHHPHIHEAIKTNSHVILPDVINAKLSGEEKILADALNLRSLLYLPLTAEKKAIGVLVLGSIGRQYKFLEHEVSLCRTFSNLTSLSIEKTQLFEKLNQNIAELKQAIVEKNNATEALKVSEGRFRNLFENNLSVMLLVDPADGSIVDVNRSAEKYYGWSHDEFVKLKIQDINLQKEKSNLSLSKSLEEKRVHFEFKHRTADGSVRDVEVFSSKVDINGKILSHSIIFDITQRRIAEKQLMLLNRAMEQSPVSIIITNSLGSIEYVNPKFCEITGYTFEEVSGKNPRILKSGEHSKSFYKELWDKITTGKEWRGELLDKKRNGDLYWQSTSISPIVDKTGIITHFLAVMEDITEKKKMINDLVAAKDKAEESDRLKTSFLHNISHEIRTPMNAIIGFSDMLRMPNLLPEKRQYFSQIIRDNSSQLLSIIDDIINVATIEAGRERAHEKEANINKLLQFIKTQYSLKVVSQKVTFIVTSGLSDEESLIRTDETKLLQILSNLISNAIKFTQKGFIKVNCELNGKFIEFSVEDTGIGIPFEMHQKIFDRFFQVDSGHNRTYGGTGLGLSIVKAYVQILNGEIYLNSKTGKGSLFRFVIPYKPAKSKTKTIRIESKAGELSALPATVLIVDDELANFELLREYLSKLELTIIYAEDGLKAVKACKDDPSISLVLMDVKMPQMDGYEASRQIKEFRPQLPIVMQTAYIYPNEREKSMMVYIDSFLKKPISQDTLLDAIQKYLTGN